jgi:DNA-binding transcriptional regulator YiaG
MFLTDQKNCDSNLTMKKEPIDIKAARNKLGFTQEDLARKLGLALSTVSKWEQGVTSPSRLAREKLEKFLKKGGIKKK